KLRPPFAEIPVVPGVRPDPVGRGLAAAEFEGNAEGQQLFADLIEVPGRAERHHIEPAQGFLRRSVFQETQYFKPVPPLLAPDAMLPAMGRETGETVETQTKRRGRGSFHRQP